MKTVVSFLSFLNICFFECSLCCDQDRTGWLQAATRDIRKQLNGIAESAEDTEQEDARLLKVIELRQSLKNLVIRAPGAGGERGDDFFWYLIVSGAGDQVTDKDNSSQLFPVDDIFKAFGKGEAAVRLMVKAGALLWPPDNWLLPGPVGDHPVEICLKDLSGPDLADPDPLLSLFVAGTRPATEIYQKGCLLEHDKRVARKIDHYRLRVLERLLAAGCLSQVRKWIMISSGNGFLQADLEYLTGARLPVTCPGLELVLDRLSPFLAGSLERDEFFDAHIDVQNLLAIRNLILKQICNENLRNMILRRQNNLLKEFVLWVNTPDQREKVLQAADGFAELFGEKARPYDHLLYTALVVKNDVFINLFYFMIRDPYFLLPFPEGNMFHILLGADHFHRRKAPSAGSPEEARIIKSLRFLFYSSQFSATKALELLEEKGPDGLTPLQQAREQGLGTCFELIERFCFEQKKEVDQKACGGPDYPPSDPDDEKLNEIIQSY